MSGPGKRHEDDELLAGPSGGRDLPRLGRLVPPDRVARLLVAAAAVLAAVTAGPGLLSGSAPAPADQPRGPAVERDDGPAATWTGDPQRPSGNRFVQSPVRLLRLPA